MYNKLEVNADHYKTKRAKISYVFLRTTGTALDTIRPNVHEGPTITNLPVYRVVGARSATRLIITKPFVD